MTTMNELKKEKVTSVSGASQIDGIPADDTFSIPNLLNSG
jgi:hypothetical protein